MTLRCLRPLEPRRKQPTCSGQPYKKWSRGRVTTRSCSRLIRRPPSSSAWTRERQREKPIQTFHCSATQLSFAPTRQKWQPRYKRESSYCKPSRVKTGASSRKTLPSFTVPMPNPVASTTSTSGDRSWQGRTSNPSRLATTGRAESSRVPRQALRPRRL